jgi:hypothetical protein
MEVQMLHCHPHQFQFARQGIGHQAEQGGIPSIARRPAKRRQDDVDIRRDQLRVGREMARIRRLGI